ncbi:hypothetical protein HA402_005145 [Bradysia odoriphaga]|nr:hypothetical protein HA402_005145 [Bradysia odoriphaga]
MTIDRKANFQSWHAECLYQEKVNTVGGKCVKLTAPLLIEANYLYAINFKSDVFGSQDLYTYVRGFMLQLRISVAWLKWRENAGVLSDKRMLPKPSPHLWFKMLELDYI